MRPVAYHGSIPLKVKVGLALAVILDTGVQILWKSAASLIPNAFTPMTFVNAVLHQPLFIVVAVMMLCQVINWLKVLQHADLSFAHPFTALSYVSVCFLSVYYLGETIDVLVLTGIGLIFVGVWFISRTDHVSDPKESDV